MDEYKKRKPPKVSLTLVPLMAHIYIFNICFCFGYWRNSLTPEIDLSQLRILAGSIAITAFFLYYYSMFFQWVYDYYKGNDRKIWLGSIILMSILVIVSHLIGYYRKAPIY